jgi:hypothetical protein
LNLLAGVFATRYGVVEEREAHVPSGFLVPVELVANPEKSRNPGTSILLTSNGSDAASDRREP